MWEDWVTREQTLWLEEFKEYAETRLGHEATLLSCPVAGRPDVPLAPTLPAVGYTLPWCPRGPFMSTQPPVVIFPDLPIL